jgi:hypothetical protein
LTLGGTDGDVAEATPVLEDLASRITHIGLAGARQLVKLVNTVLVGCGFAAITAAAMVRAADLPPDRVLAALSGGAGGLPVAPGVFLKFAHMDLSRQGGSATWSKIWRPRANMLDRRTFPAGRLDRIRAAPMAGGCRPRRRRQRGADAPLRRREITEPAPTTDGQYSSEVQQHRTV